MKYALPFILLTLLFSATTSAAVIKFDIRDGKLHGASNIGIDGLSMMLSSLTELVRTFLAAVQPPATSCSIH